MHGVAVALVAAHLFGGPRPWVSTSTAVTVAIVQSVNALALVASRPLLRRLEAGRRKACPVEEPPAGAAAASEALRALSALAVHCLLPSAASLRAAAGGCGILALARCMKLSGALTKPQHAVLPALVLALGARLLLASAAAGGREHELESAGELEPELAYDEDGRFDLAEDPYHPSFWEGVAEHEVAEGPPSSERISADMYLRCVLQT